MSKSILITGSTGYVGKYLARDFSEIFNLYTINRQPVKFSEKYKNYEIKRGGIIDVNHFIEIDTVIHCMGIAHKKIYKSHSHVEAINVELTVQIANAAVKAGVKKFIFISTANVYEQSSRDMEKYFPDTYCSPDEPYAISKLKAEMELQKIFQVSKSKLIIIRPPLIYGGEKFKGNLRLLEILIRLRIPLPIGLLSVKRSYLSLENLSNFIKKCIDSEFPCDKPFLIRDDKRMTLIEVAEMISKTISIKVRFFNLNARMLRVIVTLAFGKRIASKFFQEFDLDQQLTFKITGWRPKDYE
jgi:nucleoside-diphosphate-sugar epimerase